jgi:hypothetical protein
MPAGADNCRLGARLEHDALILVPGRGTETTQLWISGWDRAAPVEIRFPAQIDRSGAHPHHLRVPLGPGTLTPAQLAQRQKPGSPAGVVAVDVQVRAEFNAELNPSDIPIEVRQKDCVAKTVLRIRVVEFRSEFQESARPPPSPEATPDPAVDEHFAEGRVAQDQGYHDKAEVEFRKALQMDPKRQDIWDALGAMLYEDRQYAKAVAAYRKLVELDPKAHFLHAKLATALFDANAREEAMTEARAALDLLEGHYKSRMELRKQYPVFKRLGLGDEAPPDQPEPDQSQ